MSGKPDACYIRALNELPASPCIECVPGGNGSSSIGDRFHAAKVIAMEVLRA